MTMASIASKAKKRQQDKKKNNGGGKTWAYKALRQLRSLKTQF